jgi:hypothetical protein
MKVKVLPRGYGGAISNRLLKEGFSQKGIDYLAMKQEEKKSHSMSGTK